MNVKLKDVACFFCLFDKKFWINSASYEYRNRSAKKWCTACAHGNANGPPENTATKNNKLVVHQEAKHRNDVVFSIPAFGTSVVSQNSHQVTILVSKTESDPGEQREDPAMHPCLQGLLCNLGIQYKYGSSRESVSTLRPNDDKTDLWLSKTSDSEKVVALPSAERMLSKGSTMVGEQVARVVCSKNSAYKTGEFVLANVGWRTVTRITNTKSVRKLPALGDVPVSESLGIMGLTGLTAYYGLLEICQPTEGDVVVVTAAAGAVGSAVGQIAKIKGCRVIGICGSGEKCRWITQELGMDIAINYKTDDVDAKLKSVAKEGIDCFFDNVGGDLSSVILHRMKLRGRVALCGTISLYHQPIDFPTMGMQPYRAILYNQLRVEGFSVLRWFQSWSQGHADLLLWIQEGRLKGRQTLYNGFDKMPEAFLGLFSGTNIGKTLVKIL